MPGQQPSRRAHGRGYKHDIKAWQLRLIVSMDALNITDVTRIATEAARQLSPRLHIVGVTSGGSGGEYAEVVVDIDTAECRQEPRRMSLGVFRNTSESLLHHEITLKLRQFRERP